MRPRVFPAEDSGEAVSTVAEKAASMRPRVFPAEDCSAWRGSGPVRSGFNEAAGIPRGRRTRTRSCWPSISSCFNEAAGIPRGRPATFLAFGNSVRPLQ